MVGDLFDMFLKYPKTTHIKEYWNDKARLDSSLPVGQFMIVEEKMDGTQVGISFDKNGKVAIQSRGSYISSEPEYSLLKQWVWQHHAALFDRLTSRYILFGEWLYAKHTIFYDLLPDYFLEFDVYDRENEIFLSTLSREKFWENCEFIFSVRVIDALTTPTENVLNTLLTKSAFISEDAFYHMNEIEKKQTDTIGLMEGLYLKIEDQSQVIERYKLVRTEFIQKIVESGSHWKNRELKLNKLRAIKQGLE